ncbi:MAG: PAS domain S-box protein [Geothrix sp.]|nr:PAS domain S-box protein [Geothrix sp.]
MWPFGLGLLLAAPLILFLAAPGFFSVPSSASKAGEAVYISLALPTAMVAAMTFGAARLAHGNSRSWMLTVLGPVFLALALLKLTHLVALAMDPGHLGMERLALSTTLSRLVVAAGFLAVALAPADRTATPRTGNRLVILSLLFALLAALALWFEPWGPSSLFMDGSRFSWVKQGGHLVLGGGFLLCAMGFLWPKERRSQAPIAWLGAASLAWSAGEFSHAQNPVPFGPMGLLGHGYFLVAAILTHGAVFKAAFQQPFLELSRSRAESQAREERLQLAFEGAEEGYWDWDLRAGKVYRSPGALSMFGYFPEEAEATLDFMARLMDPEALPEIQAAMQEHLEGGTPRYKAEYRCRTQDGRWIWVLDQGRVVQRDGRGRPLRMAGTVKEITIRKQMEAALQASEVEARKLALVASHTDNSVIITDAQTRIEWVNEAFTRITGYSLEEARGRKVGGLLQGPDSDPAVIQIMRDHLQAGEGFSAEIQNHAKTGRPFWVALSVQPIRDERGALSHWISIERDITERKKSEETLRQTQKLESLGLLASGIAHDFNNLLGAIRGNVDLAQLKRESGQSPDANCHNIKVIVDRASDLTRQLMSYAGKGTFDIKSVDLNALVSEMAALLSVSLSKKVAISYHLGEGLPGVGGDPAQLQQVAMNLVINGNDAIGDQPGTIQIRTGLLALDEEAISRTLPGQPVAPGPHVLLEVADSGCGMTPETLARIFDPFYTTKAQGRGLGLSAMLGILRSHHAGIQVESALGIGTTFRIYLPAWEGERRAEAPATLHTARYSGRALVVEDDAEIRRTSVGLMEALGFEVREARDGQEGVECFQTEGPFDLVLMDVLMPKLDGFAACKAMTEHSREVRIIHCSGTATLPVVRESCSACDRGERRVYLPKPFGLQDLQRAVAEVLEEADQKLPPGNGPSTQDGNGA